MVIRALAAVLLHPPHHHTTPHTPTHSKTHSHTQHHTLTHTHWWKIQCSRTLIKLQNVNIIRGDSDLYVGNGQCPRPRQPSSEHTVFTQNRNAHTHTILNFKHSLRTTLLIIYYSTTAVAQGRFRRWQTFDQLLWPELHLWLVLCVCLRSGGCIRYNCECVHVCACIIMNVKFVQLGKTHHCCCY